MGRASRSLAVEVWSEENDGDEKRTIEEEPALFSIDRLLCEEVARPLPLVVSQPVPRTSNLPASEQCSKDLVDRPAAQSETLTVAVVDDGRLHDVYGRGQLCADNVLLLRRARTDLAGGSPSLVNLQ